MKNINTSERNKNKYVHIAQGTPLLIGASLSERYWVENKKFK